MKDFTPQAVLVLTNTMALEIEILEFDIVKARYIMGGRDNSDEPYLVSPLMYDEDADPYFELNGETFYISEFIKINI